MNVQAYFRLFDLPYELVEYVSFTFKRHEAHKLLTVSSDFHSLFARRVWWWLDSRVFTLSDPTRSMAIARYGKLVRQINLYDGICSAIRQDIKRGYSIYDILSVFSGVTSLRIWLDQSRLASNGMQYKDILICFPSLYMFDVEIEMDREPYDLVTLALAINHRQNNCNMNPIECLSVEYKVRDIDSPWSRLISFVQMVLENCVMKIEITPSFHTLIIPSQSELQILSKYFVRTPDIAKKHDAQFCYATLNRSLFCKPLHLYNTCGYPQLRQLYVQTCCASSDTYNYCDFTPVNIPCLRKINIIGHECNNMISYLYPPAWKKVLLQNWPYLDELTLSVNMTCEQFVAVLEYNRKLIRLEIWLQPKMLDKNSIFNLATIFQLLPNLRCLWISSNHGMILDYNPNYQDDDILARSQLTNTAFRGLHLSSRIYRFLYLLPTLYQIDVQRCKFYSTGIGEDTKIDTFISDPNEHGMTDTDENDDDDEEVDDDVALYLEFMAMINTISARFSLNNTCCIKFFILDINWDDHNWPLDVTLEMIALMPNLRILYIIREANDLPKAVKTRFPHVIISYLGKVSVKK
ncbi:hypothetical protein GQ42DRAFT_8382 [Ramicandelaber brevisporus]|nr:hypothetical protein GQ42DRAFT_8382 [Ramicandelaber brevisporus]